MFFWVLKKETAIEAVSEGIEKRPSASGFIRLANMCTAR